MKKQSVFKKFSRVITIGIEINLPKEVQLFIWNVLENFKKESLDSDYLHVFTFNLSKKLFLTHSQETPFYKKKYALNMKDEYRNLNNLKVYVIDDFACLTMLLADEY